MGTLHCLIVAVCLLASPGGERPGVAVVKTDDGSKLVGTLEGSPIELTTAYGLLRIAPGALRRYEVTGSTVILREAGGDRYTGTVSSGTLTIRTSFGPVDVPLPEVRSIEVVQATMLGETTSAAPLPEPRLLLDFEGGATLGDTPIGPAIVAGEAGLTSSPRGRGAWFDGRGWLEVAHDPETGLFPVDAPFSVSVWFMTEAQGAREQSIISTHTAGSGEDGWYLFVDQLERHQGRLRWWVGPGLPGETSVVSREPVNDGAWHHAVGTWDGEQARLYVDGVLQGTMSTPGPITYGSRPALRIGHSVNTNAPWALDEKYRFHGVLDELGVYDVALTAEQVTHLATPAR